MSDYPTKWKLEQLAIVDFEKELNNYVTVSRVFVDKWKNNQSYLTDPVILKEALDECEFYVANFNIGGRLAYYYWLKLKLDQNNPDLKAFNNKIQETVVNIENELRFFEHNLMKIEKTEQEKILEDKSLIKYRHYLMRLFEIGKYELSEAEENILALKSKTSHSNWIQMTAGLLSKEKIKGKNLEELLNLIRDKDKTIRDQAALSINKMLKKYQDMAEAELNSVLEDKKINDKLRKTKRADELRFVGDDIDKEVVDSMLQAVEKRNDISIRYYKFKAKLLGLPKLAYHERAVSYGKIDKKYSFDEGTKLVAEVMEKLDPELRQIYDNFLINGLVDVYPISGKHGGAFCISFIKKLPSFIMLNWTDSLNDVTTLAHEMGHGINNELMRTKQHSLYWHSPTSTAEVASTFFEDFALEHMAKEADKEVRLAILVAKLNNDVSSIFRQVACYRFEQDLHKNFREKGYLSKTEIGKLFTKNMSAYMGEGVEQSKGSENWWIYWSHIRTFFYVYSYASGQLLSKSLQNSVKKDPQYIHKVKEFLAAGSSDSPKNIFANLGIDISDEKFWEKGLDEIEKMLDEAEELAGKLGKG